MFIIYFFLLKIKNSIFFVSVTIINSFILKNLEVSEIKIKIYKYDIIEAISIIKSTKTFK
jgi:hypothetical protein